MIRPLAPRDIPAIVEIDRAAFTADEQYEGDFYGSILAKAGLSAFAMQIDDTIVGWVLLDVSVKPVRLRSLSVHPRCQRRGYGKALLENALTKFLPMDLLVKPDNAAAIALYEALRFKPAAPDPEMPDRLRMVRWR